jgi:hypothetical protein
MHVYPVDTGLYKHSTGIAVSGDGEQREPVIVSTYSGHAQGSHFKIAACSLLKCKLTFKGCIDGILLI